MEWNHPYFGDGIYEVTHATLEQALDDLTGNQKAIDSDCLYTNVKWSLTHN